MKLEGFLVFKAIISLVDGIALVVVPIVYMNLVDVYLGDAGVFMTRFFGTLLIGIGLICWFSRGVGRARPLGVPLSPSSLRIP